MESDVSERLATDLAVGFECLVREQQHQVYAFAWSLTGNPHDAEDVSQEAFIRAWRALREYEPERFRALKPRPWLFAIAHNVWRNRVRGKHLPTSPLDEVAWAIPAPGEAEPAAQVEAAERTETLARLIARLPEKYRAAMVLRHAHGLGYGEVAVVLGLPTGTVKAQVHRGVGQLRAWLAEE